MYGHIIKKKQNIRNIKHYIKPAVQVKLVAVENGFALSNPNPYTTIVCGSEGLSDGGVISFGTGGNDNGSMMEGVGDNGQIDF